MNFFSVFGPNINMGQSETPRETNSANELLGNMLSTELQELLQPILSGANPNTTTTETQTSDTQTEEIFYFEPVNTPQSLSINDLNQISTLETKTNEDEMICVICHNAVEQNSIYRKLNECGHTYHVNCIDEWLNTNATCPTCRVNLVPQTANTTTNRVPRRNTNSFSIPLYSFRYS